MKEIIFILLCSALQLSFQQNLPYIENTADVFHCRNATGKIEWLRDDQLVTDAEEATINGSTVMFHRSQERPSTEAEWKCRYSTIYVSRPVIRYVDTATNDYYDAGLNITTRLNVTMPCGGLEIGPHTWKDKMFKLAITFRNERSSQVFLHSYNNYPEVHNNINIFNATVYPSNSSLYVRFPNLNYSYNEFSIICLIRFNNTIEGRLNGITQIHLFTPEVTTNTISSTTTDDATSSTTTDDATSSITTDDVTSTDTTSITSTAVLGISLSSSLGGVTLFLVVPVVILLLFCFCRRRNNRTFVPSSSSSSSHSPLPSQSSLGVGESQDHVTVHIGTTEGEELRQECRENIQYAAQNESSRPHPLPAQFTTERIRPHLLPATSESEPDSRCAHSQGCSQPPLPTQFSLPTHPPHVNHVTTTISPVNSRPRNLPQQFYSQPSSSEHHAHLHLPPEHSDATPSREGGVSEVPVHLPEDVSHGSPFREQLALYMNMEDGR